MLSPPVAMVTLLKVSSGRVVLRPVFTGLAMPSRACSVVPHKNWMTGRAAGGSGAMLQTGGWTRKAKSKEWTGEDGRAGRRQKSVSMSRPLANRIGRSGWLAHAGADSAGTEVYTGVKRRASRGPGGFIVKRQRGHLHGRHSRFPQHHKQATRAVG